MKWKKFTLFITLAVVSGFIMSDISASARETKLVIYRSAEALANPITKGYIKEFEKTHPGVKIEMFTFPYQELRTKLSAAIAGGTGPDQMQIDTPWLVEYAEAGLLDPAPEDVTKDIEQNFLPIAKWITSYKGVHYGYPWWLFTNALFYNRDMFKEAGLDPDNPPKTWTELEQYAKRLVKRKADGTMIQAGYTICHRLLWLTDYLYNNNAAVVGEDERGIPEEPIKGTLNTPEAVEVFKFLYKLYNIDKVGDFKFGDFAETFVKGRAAMTISANWMIPWIEGANPELNYTVVDMPTPTGGRPNLRVDAWIQVVANYTTPEKKKIAWEFLKKYISNSQWDMYFNAMSIPSRLDIINDPRIVRFSQPRRYYGTILKRGISRTKPFVRGWEEMTRRVEPIIEALLLDNISPEEAARKANEEVNAVLRGE